MRVILGVLVAFCVSSCVTLGSRPTFVTVNLTSGLEKVAYTEEQLTVPSRRAIVEKCLSGNFSNCDYDFKPVDDLYEISRDRISTIYVRTILSGLDRNKVYELELKITSPNKSLERRETYSFETPSSWQRHQGYVITRYWTPAFPRSIALGDWKFQIIVNGQQEGVRYLKVIDLHEAQAGSNSRH